MEVTYWEALRIFWRFYWPASVSVTGLSLLIGVVSPFVLRSTLQVLAYQLVQYTLFAALLVLFVQRIFSRPFRGFSLTLIQSASGLPGPLTLERSVLIARFLALRLLGGTLAGMFLLMPLNMFLGLFRVSLPQQVFSVMVILILGPLLTKLLVGENFAGARVEVKRSSDPAIAVETATDPG